MDIYNSSEKYSSCYLCANILVISEESFGSSLWQAKIIFFYYSIKQEPIIL